jgi:transposase
MLPTKFYEKLLKLTPPWRVIDVELKEDVDPKHVLVFVEYNTNELVHCPDCEELCARYDSQVRRWRHLDTMDWQTILSCPVPRANCNKCGIKQVRVPWSEPKSRWTLLFEARAIDVLLAAKSNQATQTILDLSWDEVHRIQARAVDRGIERRDLSAITRVGVDEKNFGQGHDYASILSDPDGRRVLEVVHGRDQKSADLLWEIFSKEQLLNIQAVCMDMWEAFMNSAHDNVAHAQVVHDKFHCAKYLNEAVDKVRKLEHQEFLGQGEGSPLTKTKYLWMKNPNNWSEHQQATFRELKNSGLKVARAWAIKELFSEFWNYLYPASSLKFFNRWFWWATHSKLKPMIDVAKLLKRHLPGLLAYTKHRITNASAEGFNSKIQMIKSIARGFRSFPNYRVAILFHCGRLNLYPLVSQ